MSQLLVDSIWKGTEGQKASIKYVAAAVWLDTLASKSLYLISAFRLSVWLYQQQACGRGDGCGYGYKRAVCKTTTKQQGGRFCVPFLELASEAFDSALSVIPGKAKRRAVVFSLFYTLQRLITKSAVHWGTEKHRSLQAWEVVSNSYFCGKKRGSRGAHQAIVRHEGRLLFLRLKRQRGEGKWNGNQLGIGIDSEGLGMNCYMCMWQEHRMF